jgi:hypothetical protein
MDDFRLSIRALRASPIVSFVAVLSFAPASSLAVQATPELSGVWTIDTNRSVAVGGGAGAREAAGGGRGGGLGLGPAPDRLTIRQDANAITVQERRGTTTTSLKYALDGSKTTNTVPAGRHSGASAVYVTAWRDRRLITSVTVPDAQQTGSVVTYEEVRYVDVDGSLVVETTMTGRPNKRTTVYTRVSPSF